jgi:hypothetical protein
MPVVLSSAKKFSCKRPERVFSRKGILGGRGAWVQKKLSKTYQKCEIDIYSLVIFLIYIVIIRLIPDPRGVPNLYIPMTAPNLHIRFRTL